MRARQLLLAALFLMCSGGFVGLAVADPTQPQGQEAAGVFGEDSQRLQPDPVTGAMAYAMPLQLPRARGAAQPTLSVTYNSSATDREAGYGWAMRLPSIERKPLSGWTRNIDDGNPIHEDRYVFGTQPLVFVCVVGATGCDHAAVPPPAWAAGWRSYRLQVEGLFARFYLDPSRTTWRVQMKGGIVQELGAPLFETGVSPQPAIELGDANKPFRWRLVRQVDIDGNVVVYVWKRLGTTQLLYLTDIYDTPLVSGLRDLDSFAHHAQIEWEPHGFAMPSYAPIERAMPEFRLTRVATASALWSGTKPREMVRAYHFAYYATRGVPAYNVKTDAPLWHHSFLKQVQLEGSCETAEAAGRIPVQTRCPRFPATTFEYQSGELNSKGGVFSAQTHDTPPGEDETNFQVFPWVESVSVVDLNRDGLPDLVQSWPGNSIVDVTNYADFFRKKPAYLNIGDKGLLQIQLRHQCMDMGSGNPGDLAFYNLGRPAAFLTGSGAASVLGAWGDSLLLWSKVDYAQMTADSVPAQSAFCDMAATDPAHGAWRWHKGDEVGWSKHQQGAPSPLSQNRWFADIDGDGLADSFDRTAGAAGIDLESAHVDFTRRVGRAERPAGAAMIPFVPNFSAPVDSLVPAEQPRSDTRFWYLDVNGDGLVDLVTTNPADMGGVPQVRPGNGRGLFECNTRLDSAPCIAAPAGAPPWLTATYAINVPDAKKPWPFTADTYFYDVTGDGLADIIQYEAGSGQNRSSIRLWINVDGHTFRCAKPTASDPCRVNMFFDGLHGSFTIDPYRITFADMDANGIADMVLIGKSGVWASSVYNSPAAVTPRAPRPGLLTRIDNGLGAVTSIDYRTIQELDLDATARREPWEFHSPQVVPVVIRVRIQDVKTASGAGTTPSPYRFDRSTTYEYRDPAYDPWSRSFVGFRKVRSQRGFDAGVTETTYWFGPCQRGVKQCPDSSDDDPLKALSGRPIRVDRFVPEVLERRPGKLLSTTLYEYANDTLFQLPGDRSVRHAYAHVTETFLYDANAPFQPGAPFVFVPNGDMMFAPAKQPGRAHVVEMMTMDANGNVVETVSEGRPLDDGTLNPGIDGRIKTSFAVHCTAFWQCLTDVKTITSNPVKGPERKTRYSYDARGKTRLMEANLQGTLALDRHHETAGAAVAPAPNNASVDGWIRVARLDYDGFGNLTQIEGAGTAAPCTTIRFDSQYGQFPATTEVHPAGCASPPIVNTRVFDRGLGGVVANRSASGALSEFTFDPFGRPLTVKSPLPDGAPLATVSSLTIAYNDRSPLSWMSVSRHTGAGPTLDRVDVFNGLGEAVVGFDKADPTAGDLGGWVLRDWTERDAVGRLVQTYRPVFFTGNPQAIAAAAIPLTAPVGAGPIRYSYDAFGRALDTSEGGMQATKFAYEPLAVEVFDAEQLKPGGSHLGQSTKTLYDGHGRATASISTIKGDAIRVDTLFLATGEPSRIVQSHAASSEQVTRTIDYDSLGRMVRNVEPNTSTASGASWRYAWDDAGRLVGTSDARGCGENIHYDGFGRVRAEDYSPCMATHAAYTLPNLVSGDGTEAFYGYDAYESGQVNPTPNFADDKQLAIGKLVSVWDRGAHTRMAYDNRGRARRISRRMALPGASFPLLAGRYTNHRFERNISYDFADRVTVHTTGVDLPTLLAGGASFASYGYSARGKLRQITSPYGMLLQSARFDADGTPAALVYGDAAKTQVAFQYDPHRRLVKRTVSRSAPALWTVPNLAYALPNAQTTQLQLEAVSLSYDDVGNPIQISDASPPSTWPVGAKPVTRTVGYDDLYRVTRVDYATGTDTQVSPYAAEEATSDRLSVPVRGKNRVAFQRFDYDWNGNTTASDDDQKLRYDRSLGTIANGEALGKPNQLVTAEGMTAHHDAAGNLVDLTVERRSCPGAAPLPCTHRFVYEWDEIGQLARAARWDFPGGPIGAGEPSFPAAPNGAPVWDLHYAYSQGARVLKSAKNRLGDQRHTVDVFNTLRLEKARFRSADFEIDADNVSASLAGIGRLVHDAALPSPSGSANHVFLNLSDALGSTHLVIDRETGELVERIAYQAYGGVESDYRPQRWSSHSEAFQFTGKEKDMEVGATYFGARYYQPYLGRFMSADPLTVHGVAGDLNPYAYVGGRVTSAVDPLGLCPQTGTRSNDGGTSTVSTSGDCPTDPDNRADHAEAMASQATIRQPISIVRDNAGPTLVETPPELLEEDDNVGQAASSAGGFRFPRVKRDTKSELLAKQNPSLAPQIHAAARQEFFLKHAPLLLMIVPGAQANAALVDTELALSTDTVSTNMAWGARLQPSAIESSIAPRMTMSQGYALGNDLGAVGETLTLGKYPGNVQFVRANPGTYTVDRPWGWTPGYNAGAVRGHLDAGGPIRLTSETFTGTYKLEVEQILNSLFK